MGKKKRSWRKKYSLEKYNKKVVKPRQRRSLRRRHQPPQKNFNSVDARIAEKIYGIVCKGDFKSDECKKVSKDLLRRLGTYKPLTPLGQIKNFEIPIEYVRPTSYDGDLTIGNNFGISLPPWHHESYIIMLKNPIGGPAILLTWGEEGSLIGAANFLTNEKRKLNYPSFLYDRKKIESLFYLKCIEPFTPSSNYKEI